MIQTFKRCPSVTWPDGVRFWSPSRTPARAGVDEWEAGPLRPILSPGRFQPAPGKGGADTSAASAILISFNNNNNNNKNNVVFKNKTTPSCAFSFYSTHTRHRCDERSYVDGERTAWRTAGKASRLVPFFRSLKMQRFIKISENIFKWF